MNDDPQPRLGAGRFVVMAGVGLAAVGFLVSFGSIARAMIVGATGDPFDLNPATVVVPFVIGMGMSVVGGLLAVLGGGTLVHRLGGSRTIYDDGAYETITRPKRAEPIAQHGASVHELIDDRTD